jgi:hypothetical protein
LYTLYHICVVCIYPGHPNDTIADDKPLHHVTVLQTDFS